MLSQEIKDQIRKDVLNELAVQDAVYIMENYLASIYEDEKRYYRNKMQEFINKQNNERR